MRVIAGKYRSRRLVAPHGWETRPTSDRLRETLFNVLATRAPASVFVDLYAGTGAVGIEALSRGAAQVYFSETARAALAALRTNLRSLGIDHACTIEPRGALPLLRKLAAMCVQADIVFLDPPYADAKAYASTLEFLAASSVLQEDALVVVEQSSHADALRLPANLREVRSLVQGDARMGFYSVQPFASPGKADLS
jgi:16S rRNA (guanine(966)-N(2))-methyltransferase RsmD